MTEGEKRESVHMRYYNYVQLLELCSKNEENGMYVFLYLDFLKSSKP